MITVVFFFSSRRRHTRLQGDWSSDVCSSDLSQGASDLHFEAGLPAAMRIRGALRTSGEPISARGLADFRSEERRVGEEGRSRWAPDHLKKKKKKKIRRHQSVRSI